MSNSSGVVKLQWAALVVLVLAVGALLVLLSSQHREYRSHAAAAAVGASATQSPTPTGSASPNATESASPSATQSPTPSASTGSSAAAASRDSVDAVTRAAQTVVNSEEDVVISVLGDSTSDSSTEWVYQWAQELGQDASVVVHTWDPEAGGWFPQTRQYGQGERTVTIWNGSEAGATPAAPLAQDDLRQPEPADLTILNYGHHGGTDEVEPALTELLEGLEAGSEDAAPVVLTAQNPATGDRAKTSFANRDLMLSAAQQHGLPVIDVYGAFAEAGAWEVLLVDPIHPGERGHQLWADTVSAFFTP